MGSRVSLATGGTERDARLCTNNTWNSALLNDECLEGLDDDVLLQLRCLAVGKTGTAWRDHVPARWESGHTGLANHDEIRKRGRRLDAALRNWKMRPNSKKSKPFPSAPQMIARSWPEALKSSSKMIRNHQKSSQRLSTEQRDAGFCCTFVSYPAAQGLGPGSTVRAARQSIPSRPITVAFGSESLQGRLSFWC